jgi:hypothetical protein
MLNIKLIKKMKVISFFIGVLIVMFIVVTIKAFIWLRGKHGVKQFVEVLENDKYKIITEVYLKNDLIRKYEKECKGEDAENVAAKFYEKGMNHYNIIKKFNHEKVN